jgi:hypothetical protein
MKFGLLGFVLPFVLAATTAGCSKRTSTTSVTGSIITKSGLHAEGNNADVVKAAEVVLASCGADFSRKRGFEDCAPLDKDFRDMKIRSGREDKTFIAFLEDPDEKVRALGVKGLHAWGDDYKTDKDMAARLVGALEKESCPAIDGAMADLVADLDPSKVGLGERVAALALKPETTTDVKAFLVAWWGHDGGGVTNTFAYDLVKHYASAREKRLQLAALEGYATFFGNHTDEACKVWFDGMSSADGEIAARSAGELTGGWSVTFTMDEDSHWQISGSGRSTSFDGRCKEVDAAVAQIAARAKAGKIDDSKYVSAAAFVVGDKKATPAQRHAATAAMHAIIENKANGYERGDAIRDLVRGDPSQKAYVAKFANDKDLANYVKAALEYKKS